MTYVIKSDIAYGYWSNDQGWVYDVESATKYPTHLIGMTSFPVDMIEPDAIALDISLAKDFDPDMEP